MASARTIPSLFALASLLGCSSAPTPTSDASAPVDARLDAAVAMDVPALDLPLAQDLPLVEDMFQPFPDTGPERPRLPMGIGFDESFDVVELLNDRNGTPHGISLRRAPSLDDALLIANSYGGFYRFEAARGMAPRLRYFSDATMPRDQLVFCHRVDVHRASGTIFCGGLMVEGIGRFEGATGRFIDLAPAGGAPNPYDLLVHGDALYFTALTGGLWRRAIRTDGTLDAPMRLEEGAFVNLVEVPGGVVALERTRGVVLRRDDGSSVAYALPGPPQNARLHGGELLVALGSQGIARIDLAGGGVQHLPVGCVASAVDANDTALVVGCRRGLRLYALPARGAPLGPLRGATQSVFGVTDVLIEGDQCLSLDWRRLLRHTIRSDRMVSPRADRPFGVPVARERGSRFEVYNPYEVPVLAGPLTLAPGGRGWIEARPGQSEVPIDGDRRPEDVVVAATIDSDAVAPGRSAGLALRDRWVVAFQPDCALQWLDVEDLLWLSSRGGLGDGRDVQLLVIPSSTNFPVDEFMTRWAPLRYMNLATTTLTDHPGISYEQAQRRFGLVRFLGGPDDTTVMRLDAEGRIAHLANQYLGRHLLRIEPLP